MRDNFDGINVFIEVVKAGSFSLAATHLALSRSAVGKTIARLEERLGARLFHRTTRTVTLTEDGQLYYERCLRAVDELKEGEELLESGRHDVAGKLRVTMPLLFGRYCIAPILVKLAARYPRLELDLHFSDHTVDLIGDRYDLAIRNHAPGVGVALDSKVVATQGKVICASPDYLEKYGTPDSINALEQHQTLTYLHKGVTFPWTFCLPGEELRSAPLCVRLQFDSYDAIADATLTGAGIAYLPDWLVKKELENGRLVQLFSSLQLPRSETFAVWPSTQFVSLKIKAALSAIDADINANEHTLMLKKFS
ncbi:LysR family transcriptional regulator [Gluconobacter cerinus]|uniref:LysR family transcriptional regulator n=1 Tax=Gluconobacter cerinus TaxID=38307 RepID=UPI001B8B09C9|nr:LysR family transcriptional regulator [Gluconobacter cerinus]MBS1038556.1 LysR family transcriptional regulator [Gluconobacter cerinus]